MSTRKPRTGRFTPRAGAPSRSAPAQPDAPSLLPPDTLRSLLGDPSELSDADPLTIELRASFAWSFLQRRGGVELFRALMATLQEGLRRSSPDARDYLRMLATVAEPTVAKQFAQLLRYAGIATLPPRWVNFAGRAVVEQAQLYENELGDVYNVNLLCRYPDATEQHELVAFLDANYGWFLDIGAFPRTRPDDDLPDNMTRRDISLAEARAHLDRAVAWAPALDDHPDTAKVTARVRLIAHYAESLPTGFELHEREPMTDDASAILVDEFFATAHGRSLSDHPSLTDAAATRELLQSVVITAHNVLAGKPLRLTPQSVGLITLARRGDEAADDPRLPIVLRALVAYAHERNGWGDRYLADTLAAIG
jgi:hypothetical protein